jgi:hypothetical protein
MYNGEERRKEDRSILVLSERLNTFMETTTEYRKSLCAKLDTLRDDIIKLPCSKGHDMHVDRQLGAIWWIVSICMVGVLSVAMAWGAMNNQVVTNTQRWDRYLQEQAHGESSRV